MKKITASAYFVIVLTFINVVHSIDYSDVDFETQVNQPKLESFQYSAKSPSRPATSRPATSRPATSRPATSRPATSRPATSRPATSRPATSRPATSRPATSRPATSRPATSRPATSRPATSRPATNRPATSRPVTTYRPPSTQRPSTGRPLPPSTPRPLTTYRPPSTARPGTTPSRPKSTQRPYPPSTHRPYPPSTHRPYPPPSTYRPYPPSTQRTFTLAPPPRYTTGRPLYPPPTYPIGQPKPSSSGIGGFVSKIFGSKGTSAVGSPSSGKPSKFGQIKQLATALYGAYKARKLQKRVTSNSYHSYSPYYGRNYYYGNRHYPRTANVYRQVCYYYVPENDPNYDLYYEDQSRVREIIYECDGRYETCCGHIDCCRGYNVVNGRGHYTGQSYPQTAESEGTIPAIPEPVEAEISDPGSETSNQGPGLEQLSTEPPFPPDWTTVTDQSESQSTDGVIIETDAGFNFLDLSDDDFLGFNETLYHNISVYYNLTESDMEIQTMYPIESGLTENNTLRKYV